MNREYQQRQKDLKYEARRLQALEREGYQWKKNEDLMQRVIICDNLVFLRNKKKEKCNRNFTNKENSMLMGIYIIFRINYLDQLLIQ